ncbi:MAG: DUF4010 domain-containing protein [Myxococcota bacterium]|nr:DUF4010 domain-containing protein [Myxococcota bacterium]
MPESEELRLGIALVIGLVIGAEREQRMTEGAHRAAGIRTFAITALLGAVAHLLGGPAALVLFGAGIAVLATAAYVLGDRTDPGLTSEIALLLTYALGALAMREPMIALGGGILTALLLAFRSRIHDVVRSVLTPAELRDALIVLAAALVVLPLLPNETIDPWNVLNPFVLWRLVVVILAIHFAAHVAQRMLGPRWGLPLAGLAGGFVSSSATIAAMGAKANHDEEHVTGSIAAATASTIATFVQLAILVGAASPSLLGTLAIPLTTGGVTALIWAGIYARKVAKVQGEVKAPGRAVDVKGALVFALLVTGVTIGATMIERETGAAGVIIASAIAAFADAHAASASVASVHAAGQMDPTMASIAVLVCMSTNSITKAALAIASGARSFWAPVVIGVVLTAAAAWAGLAARTLLGM